MTATSTWADESQTTLIQEFVGTWSGAEMESTMLSASDLLRARDGSVYLIVDLQRYGPPAREFNVISMVRRIAPKFPSNLALIVVVTGDPLGRAMIELMGRLNPHQVPAVSAVSLEEADKRIAKHRLQH